ncbi:LamG domain-containing protein [Nitrosopumilus sp.]|uniref:LamG domain-containing protein n=1 Tax=Nitrosopumilus sp. TaxID=2024843 RepID=UPI00261D23D7|nr:LamG domain-containing protein [Nitrosopumilus sp.]
MRKHRGLSAVVGTVFLVTIVIASLSYVTYSMNMMGELSESMIVSEKREREQAEEIFQLESVEINTGKLDGIISNVGEVPLNIKSIWVEEDGSPETTKKFDVDATLSPGNTVDLGTIIDYDMVDTTGYKIKVISSRGGIQSSYINSVGNNALYLTSSTYPPVISTEFDTTVVMTVVNNSTNNSPFLNLTPTPLPVVDTSSCSPNCSATYVSGPTPASFPNLQPGESVNFSWVYTVAGQDADEITFTTSLLNGVPTNTVASGVKVREVVSSLESGTALTSIGLDDTVIGNGVLIFHEETADTPDSSYQMAPSSADEPGEHIDLSTSGVVNFFSQNSSSVITIPTGKWTGSLRLMHEHLPDSVSDLRSGNNEQVDVIYHFDSDVSSEPDSGENSRDLEVCNTSVGTVTREQYDRDSSNPEATATFGSTPGEGNLLIAIAITRTGSNSNTDAAINQEYVNVDSTTSDGWTKILQDYRYVDTGQRRGMAMWYKIAGASEPTSIDARWDNGAGTTNLRILEFSVSNGYSFVYDVSQTANSGNSNVDKQSTGWTASTSHSDALTILAAMTRDNTDFTDWRGSYYNTLEWTESSMNLDTGYRIETTTGTKESEADWSGTDRKATAAIAVFGLVPPASSSPTWVSSGGPDNSPYYSFDGDSCFDSQDTTSNSNMDIEGTPDTTALWVRANSVPDGARQFMFHADNTSSGDHYMISFGDGTSGNEGKIVFEFSTDSSNFARCMSSSDYDDNAWHHVVAVRDGSRSCELYVDGVSVDTDSFGSGGTSVDIDGGSDPYWHIGYDGTGNYFTGGIDQIFHWNDRDLISSEVTDLYNARFGDTSSTVDLYIYETTQDGTNIEPPIAVDEDVSLPFLDAGSIPETDGDFDADDIWGVYNFTNLAIPETILESGNRLNFTVNYVSGLDTYMRIDDQTMDTAPLFSSYLQVPEPSVQFPSYWTYDNDEILQVITYNTGPEGSWFQYQGTRAVFQNLDDPSGTSYSGLICSVNSTNPSILHSQTSTNKCERWNENSGWMLDEDRDSIYIPVDYSAYLYFWEIQDRPDQNDSGGTKIPPGNYHLYVFINGYDSTGKSFLRQVDIGRVVVEE